MSVLRQSKVLDTHTTAASTWSATFDSVPLEGSLLVAVSGYIGTSGITAVTIGGYTGAVLPHDDGSIGLTAGAKLAGASEPTTVTVTATGATTDSQSMVIAEFTGSFDAASITNALAQKKRITSATAYTSDTTPVLNVAGAHLVVPLWGGNGAASALGINLGHTVVAHARPGSGQTWQRACGMAWDDVTDDATHQPTWSWTTGLTSTATGMLAFPEAEASLATPTNFSFTAGSASLQLDGSWNPVAEAGTYDWQVERDSTGTGSWVAFQAGNTASTTFQLTSGVDWSTTYRGRVRSVPPVA